MGIREHLSKEVDEKDMKFSDLELDVSEKRQELEFDFDVDRDISENGKAKILERMQEDIDSFFSGTMRVSGDWTRLTSGVLETKILYPEEFDKTNFDQDQIDELKSELVRTGKRKNLSEDFLREVRCLREIIGSDFGDLKIFEKYRKRIAKELKGRIARIKNDPSKVSGNDYHGMMKDLVNYKIAWPDHYNALDVDDSLTELLSLQTVQQRHNSVFAFCYYAARMRILDPEKFDELQISQEYWEQIMKRLRSRNKAVDNIGQWNLVNDLRDFASLVKIMAAEKVWVSDQGLELQMKEKKEFKTEKKSRPERRSF